MATVIEVINLALKDINVLGMGETATADVTADCLATLNQMLGQWRTQKLYVNAQKVVSVTATGAQTYTIGAGGTINVPLPARIDSASWSDQGTDLQIEVLDAFEEYESISTKVQTGQPAYLFYQRTYPLGVIHIWPQPSTGTIRLVTRQNLDNYTALTSDLSLPDEYTMAIRFSLAELIAPSYGMGAPNLVMRFAAAARAVMKRNNTTVLPLDSGISTRWNVATDR